MILKKDVIAFGEKIEYIPVVRQRSVQPVTIGSGVWMAPGCIVIQGVEIGENSVIGTGAVVTKSVPANCLAVGVPAKVVKKLDPEDAA